MLINRSELFLTILMFQDEMSFSNFKFENNPIRSFGNDSITYEIILFACLRV